MAQQRKNTNKKPSTVSKSKTTTPPLKTGLRHEIVAIILGFCALFIALSLLGIGGFLGEWISSLFTGLIGLGAFILPFALVSWAVVLMLKKTDYFTMGKIIMFATIFILVISLTHLIGSMRPEDSTFWQYIAHAFTNGAWNNGGIIGAALSTAFTLLIGEILTYILFIALLAILFIIITGQSIFAILGKSAKKIHHTGADLREKYREKAAERAERKEEEATYAYVQTDEPIKRPFDWSEAISKETIVMSEPVVTENPTASSPFAMTAVPFVREAMQEEKPAEAAPITTLEPITDTELEYTIDIKGFVEGAEHTPDPIMPEEKNETPPWETDTTPAGINLAKTPEEPTQYVFPPVELLRENSYQPSLASRAEILENSKKLEETLQSFGVTARVVEVSKGPTVTRYELSPGSGVKVSKIAGLSDDLALNLAAESIRVEAPIPGKSVVGIEIPNKEVQAVFLREVIDDDAFWSHPSKLSFAMGKDIAGNIVVADLAKMPHLLIAGSTGSGKSVCVNTLIASIIYKATPDEVKLLMVDPKVVELSVYNGIPHLLIPVVTDPQKANGALAWAVREMDTRYNRFAETGKRDLTGYNAHLAEKGEDKLPQIVIIIDELADLMMTCGKEVEESIVRLAQKARAAGIHLIIATQRPSVDVITGLIKANVPSRLAFAVSSGTDSRTILDAVGAEKLLGKGDMLFSPIGLNKPRRIQGSFVSDKEVENIVGFIKQDGAVEYSEEMIEKITAMPDVDLFSTDSDPFIEDAIAFIVEREKASTSMLQRKFRIGYNRAARMMEELEGRGLVGPEDGAKPRKVLMTPYQHREYVQRRQEAVDASIKNGDY
ncbi:MAG: DNA translocase FtsK [Defluviitaleaceae bacterium]|nr:DNA translocase FtsK [Defluviitaleaceae bacterium]